MRNGLIVLMACAALMGCDEKKPESHPAEKQGSAKVETHSHVHEHKAPHGGTLLVVGDEYAHVELVLDASAGKMTGYVLDAEAEKAVRVGQKEIALTVNGKEVILTAVASELTGEKAGDTSEFSAEADMLKGLKTFDGVIKEITVKGQTFKDVAFKFPQGNDDHAGHGH